MYRFEQRRDPTRLLWRRLFAVLLLCLVALGVRGVWGVYQKELESRVLRAEAEIRERDLRQREAELRNEISLLKTDQGVEAELRERYDLAKEREGVIIIVDPPMSPPMPPQTTFQKFRGLFSW